MVVGALLCLSAAACHFDSPTDPSDLGLTQGEVEAFVQQVNEQVSTAVANALSRVTLSGSSFATPSDASIDGIALLIYESYTSRTNCTSGGRIEVSGTISGNDPVGTTFAVSAQMTATITDWRCISGWIINGDPYLSQSDTVRATGGNVSFDFRDGGGFKWVPAGGGPGGSCQQNITTSWSAGSGFSSGIVSCQPGNQVFTVNVQF